MYLIRTVNELNLNESECIFNFICLFLKLFKFDSNSFIIKNVRSSSGHLFLKVFIFGSYSIHLN